MYLHKAPKSVYQTRVCIPKPLRAFGYPFDTHHFESLNIRYSLPSMFKLEMTRLIGEFKAKFIKQVAIYKES
ncbi:hypothetical protein C0W38_01685 [Photobacterium angustum]|nr:hypothetical protein C0W79_13530 [Photobacterium angustum]PSX04275.1 hypothetical protein C0W87_00085 [Photobacterium angustum]PSX37873.1 hypothetical protein C0W38_01685 [Photobacterium angustum]